ncbi:UTP--glucose-1-phosphate uridylyltransferase [candidate division KSB1 bacterium]|nr:UTP--glucose-1-phosphate uridylyltransferase [candidate division KSB1 bacterium]
MSELIKIITSSDPQVRDLSLDAFCRDASQQNLLSECKALEHMRTNNSNLYERVRALFFLYAINRFHLPVKIDAQKIGLIPFDGYSHLLKRRFEEAIEIFQNAQAKNGTTDGICSALAIAYHNLGFQTLADQVRRSVRSVRGNQWMFRIGHPADHPLRVRPELIKPDSNNLFPILREATPVRMDLTHSGWSDIFFLGMDFPEGARVLNVSINLCVKDFLTNSNPEPPVEAYFRVIDKPVLRLVSVDLEANVEITSLAELFDFAKDYLGLLKAAVIASGIVPPGMEGADLPLKDLLARIVKPGFGIEIVSRVRGIPKGSRLAVSTTLLGSLISVCMRATGQTKSLTGTLNEEERRLVAARAILGEWLAGSGGGWQDSGGVWPGMKLIQGVIAGENDPEFGISRGRLLPSHKIFDNSEVAAETRQSLQDSLVLVHGGMAQDVGPILEMVTEKYLLRSEAEWKGRVQAIKILDEVVGLLKDGNVPGIGNATNRNFHGPIQTIIPWATNLYTESLIQNVKTEFNTGFYGFWMLGGMSGGGMGFIFSPDKKQAAQTRLHEIMNDSKKMLEKAIPFAMDPVVYDFSINENGTYADMLTEKKALMPPGYYNLEVPSLLKLDSHQLSRFRRAELNQFGESCRFAPELSGTMQNLFDILLPQPELPKEDELSLTDLLDKHGFDSDLHEQVKSDLRSGRIGLAQNRLPQRTKIEDVSKNDIFDATNGIDESLRKAGLEALNDGTVAVVSLAGGAGSRWTKGAGVVKALNYFCKLSGKHRNFIEVHLAKSRRISNLCGKQLPHVITTSFLTHEAIEEFLQWKNNYSYEGSLFLSPGKIIGLRMIPMIRDLHFAWEEMPQQILDEQAQKVLESLHNALMDWAQNMGEGNDYTDNLPRQCLHPVGHWYEIPNMLRNGVLDKLLAERPNLNYLVVHNIDTLGADVDPGLLGWFINENAAFATEVITRRINDRGGGLAKIDGQLRLIEGLALPNEEIEFKLSYYNSNTMWINVDKLLGAFGLSRDDLKNNKKVSNAVSNLANRMPTYITIKDVKKRWGKGQEDIYPVTQFEKLWGDMTALPELDFKFIAVPRDRGQQLKEVDELDGWLRDGSADYINSICEFV